MNVKIKVPTSLNDITVGQYQRIDALDVTLENELLDNELLRIVLGFDNVEQISKRDRNILLQDIGKAIANQGEFKQTFELNGITFGLIPNFDNITNGEYTDLIKYSQSDETLHNFLAVCYRPLITKDYFKNYKIESYEGTSKYAEMMKELPMSIAKGCQGFFLTLWNDLNNHLLTSMEVVQARGLAH